MKKFNIGLLLLFQLLYIGCSNHNKKISFINIGILKGPSAIALTKWIQEPPNINDKVFNIRMIDSPELMQASLIKGEIDLAVLPMISAVNLYNKGLDIKLLGCPVWGTLYLIGRVDSLQKQDDRDLFLFGEGTTPDILAKKYIKERGYSYSFNYSFSNPTEIMQALRNKKIELAVCAEPFVSMLMKEDTTLKVLADLNQLPHSSSYFPQSAAICKKALYTHKEEIDSLLNQSCAFVPSSTLESIEILEKADVFKSGLLSPESIKRCKIHYLPVDSIKTEVINYLNMINEIDSKAIGGKLPDEEFYN